tara:strand:- start:281 stop:481 length:201 start_codon:yes stop_codon:yes gene_type:complete
MKAGGDLWVVVPTAFSLVLFNITMLGLYLGNKVRFMQIMSPVSPIPSSLKFFSHAFYILILRWRPT